MPEYTTWINLKSKDFSTSAQHSHLKKKEKAVGAKKETLAQTAFIRTRFSSQTSVAMAFGMFLGFSNFHRKFKSEADLKCTL